MAKAFNERRQVDGATLLMELASAGCPCKVLSAALSLGADPFLQNNKARASRAAISPHSPASTCRLARLTLA